MFIKQEQNLIRKNYQENSYTNRDSNHLLSFSNRRDPDSQVNVSLINKKYKVSFPMSGNIHYATFFDTKSQAQDYLDYIINSHIK
jgi:hypothetical protein